MTRYMPVLESASDERPIIDPEHAAQLAESPGRLHVMIKQLCMES